jgi:predicted nucleotide-binding protein (sugar kinase/HSP70/actin superfamily)
LFQQQGGVKQATGDELGLKINAEFGVAIVTGLLAADVVNLLGYRLRPYEVVEGSTNLAIEECKSILEKKLEKGGSPFMALLQCRRVMKRVKVDRTIAKPVVSVIGEFWAMTTEGDGNHHLQAFLEQEGAEVSIQPLTNWILFMVWENRHDTKERMKLRTDDVARKGLDGKDPTKKLWGLAVAEKAIKGLFQSYAHAIGLYGHHLPDMEEIARLSVDTYGNDVRGGEGHMEVGKLIHFVEDKVNHMTVSVKPFGCMPSSGVSDGVQSFVTTKWPEAIFLPIEITGDGEVNVHSRVQMMLFKARQKAREEFDQALSDTGMDEQTFRERISGSRRWRRSFWRPAHKVAGAAANLVYAVK